MGPAMAHSSGILPLVCVLGVIAVANSTTPMTTLPTTPPPPPTLFTKYGASQYRQDMMLKIKPLHVVRDVSRPQCLGLCLRRRKGKRSCKAFNYGNRTCFLLSTHVCDGERNLTHASGFSYFDLVSDFEEELEFAQSKQCITKGKCSNRCRKYKLIKTPLSWQEAQAACLDEDALLAMPKSMKDQNAIVAMLKTNNMLQSWIGLHKKNGLFFYTDKSPLNWNFTVWGPDQPNDSGGTQQCVQVMSEMDYMWNDFDCSRPVGFICQYVW